MFIVARSCPEINLKVSIGQHEFTSLPRALFTVSGELLPCTHKNKLMAILEKLPNKTGSDLQLEDVTNDTAPLPPRKVTVIDGMAVVQAMGKPPWVKACAQWADHFTATLDSKCSDYDEVHLVFDRYDIPTSLKEATREKRQGGKPATAYHVTDNTPVSKMSAKQFLSSTTTKDELTVHLVKKAHHHFEGKPKVFIVTSRQETLSNSMDVQHLCSFQEADTRLILHSLDAARRGATELYIQSPDTDVFVLVIHRYHQLCRNTYFVTGVENKKRLIPLGPVVNALGAAKAEALPGFHVFSGADITGRFASKRKLTCWQALNRAPWRWYLHLLPWEPARSWVLTLNVPLKHLFARSMSLVPLWWMLVISGGRFLPRNNQNPKSYLRHQEPYLKPLPKHITRPWCGTRMTFLHPQLPPATLHGWKEEGDRLVPVPTRDPPAPATVTHLIKCGCKKTSCESNCSCRSQRLNCSEMCRCGADGMRSNVSQALLGIDEDGEEGDPSI